MFVPNWNFFAPQPAASDYRIVYLDSNSDKPGDGKWAAVESGNGHTIWSSLFNRDQRWDKACFDICQELLSLAKKSEDAISIQRQSCYQLIITYLLERAPHTPGTTHVQFLVVEDPGYENDTATPSIVFTSAVHLYCGTNTDLTAVEAAL